MRKMNEYAGCYREGWAPVNDYKTHKIINLTDKELNDLIKNLTIEIVRGVRQIEKKGWNSPHPNFRGWATWMKQDLSTFEDAHLEIERRNKNEI